WVVKSGIPAPRASSVNGPLGEYRDFIVGMNCIGRRVAGPLVEKMNNVGLLNFENFLDLGGASGTYACAFLESNPSSKGTIFDLPIAIDEAKQKLATLKFGDRLSLVTGDFYIDEYPSGYDFVWISAIIHQHGFTETAEMFRKSYNALVPGGVVAIRDVYAAPDRTSPPAAALFAVNMLANTSNGMIYTCDEVFGLLEAAGFINPRIAVPAEDMSAVIVAEKP
ncbi:MAG: methyltransferase, partial [Thermoguttaceae bacterium]